MAKGRKTGGRRPGSRNKATLRRQAAIAVAVEAFVETDLGAFTGDGVDLLRAVYQSDRFPLDVRIECAKAAARFERPSLTASHVEVSHSRKDQTLQQLSTSQLLSLLHEIDEQERRTIEGNAHELETLPVPEPENSGAGHQARDQEPPPCVP